MLLFFLSRSDALWHKQTGSSLQHLGFRGYLKYRIDYFVILREPGKQMWLACSKDIYINLIQDTKLKMHLNALSGSLRNCIFKRLVGLRTPSSSLQYSHDTRHVEITLCRAFHPTRLLNTIFWLQKLVSKMYRAKLSTADSLYLHVQLRQNYFSCCFAEEFRFWTESGKTQRIVKSKVNW